MWESFSKDLIYLHLGLEGKVAEVIHFFLYDSIKILFLLVTIIFVVSFLRTFLNTESVRGFLQGKSELFGNFLAAIFGIFTPFCSCSAIPLFLGFIQGRIPVGVTFSFLISSPMNNEIAIAMLFTLFGWKVATIYIFFGVLIATFGGYIIGKIDTKRYILLDVQPLDTEISAAFTNKTFKERVNEAFKNTVDIAKKITLYVLLGVGIGAFIHGYIPADLIATYAGESNPFAVLVAVFIGVPIYSNAAGVMPLIEVLTAKGVLLGTALAFMMSVTALSLPEAMILKRILHSKLIGIFYGVVTFGILGVGYIFNSIF